MGMTNPRLPTRSEDASVARLPNLLLRRCEGKVTATEFSRQVLRKRSRKSLLTNQQIVLASSSITHAVTTTTSLDLSSRDDRFLIAGRSDGSIELFDLSRWGADVDERANGSTTWRHSPVAQALRAPPDPSSQRSHLVRPQGHRGEVIRSQWYPADAGAFLTASLDGSLLVWDTHEMVPVVAYEPFHRFSSTKVSTSAVASRSTSTTSEVLTIDAMDVSKLSCHSVAVASRWDPNLKLIDVRTGAGGAAAHSLSGHDRGILCLQWSPSSEFVLASAGVDRTVRIWDVRKAGNRACVSVLNQHFAPDLSLSKSALPHYQHLRTQQHFSKSSSKRTQVSSSDRPVLNLAFDPSGQFLVTHDGSLAVWDLRDGQGGFLLPRRFVTPHGSVQLASASAATGAPPSRPPLCTTDDGGNGGWSAWTSIGPSLAAFSIRGESTPHQLLKGHISQVQALAAATSGDALVSAGRDGLILLWGHGSDCNERVGRDRSRRSHEDRDNW